MNREDEIGEAIVDEDEAVEAMIEVDFANQSARNFPIWVPIMTAPSPR